jgi:hypothetical protein
MSNFTLDNFKEVLHDFYSKPEPPREFVVMTGSQGMKMFNEAMQTEVFRERRITAHKVISILAENHQITLNEWNNLTKMIDSPDYENLIIVESIIEQYEQR